MQTARSIDKEEHEATHKNTQDDCDRGNCLSRKTQARDEQRKISMRYVALLKCANGKNVQAIYPAPSQTKDLEELEYLMDYKQAEEGELRDEYGELVGSQKRDSKEGTIDMPR
jgi:hypothetical protein